MPRARTVTVNVEPGGAIFARTFTRFASELTDMTPVFTMIADQLEGVAEDAFETEGMSGGGRWARLSPRYRLWKARHYPGRPILTRTGRLRRSFQSRHPGHIRRVRRDSLTWGTGVPYARFHETGTRRMPARPIIRITAADQRDWQKSVHRWLVHSATGRTPGPRVR